MASRAYASTVDQVSVVAMPAQSLSDKAPRIQKSSVTASRRRVTLGAPGKILQHALRVEIITECSYRH